MERLGWEVVRTEERKQIEEDFSSDGNLRRWPLYGGGFFFFLFKKRYLYIVFDRSGTPYIDQAGPNLVGFEAYPRILIIFFVLRLGFT